MSALSRFLRLCFVLCAASYGSSTEGEIAAEKAKIEQKWERLPEIGEQAEKLRSTEVKRRALSIKPSRLNGEGIYENLSRLSLKSKYKDMLTDFTTLLTELDENSPGAFLTRFLKPQPTVTLWRTGSKEWPLSNLTNFTDGDNPRVRCRVTIDATRADRSIFVEVSQLDAGNSSSAPIEEYVLLGTFLADKEVQIEMIPGLHKDSLAREYLDFVNERPPQGYRLVITTPLYGKDSASWPFKTHRNGAWHLNQDLLFHVEEIIRL